MSDAAISAPKDAQMTSTDINDKTLPSYAAAINAPTTDSLPSYETVLTQLRQAKNDSKNPVDYMIRACGIVCGSLIVAVFFAISAAIPVAMIVIGSMFKDQCPVNDKIPLWLIIGGVVGLVSSALRSISNCYTICTAKPNQEPQQQNSSRGSFLISVLEFFLFVWLIVGSVWVYTAKYTVTSDPTDYGNYCNPTCFFFAFWVITIAYILIAVTCCCLCCLVMCVGFGLGMSALAKETATAAAANNPSTYQDP